MEDIFLLLGNKDMMGEAEVEIYNTFGNLVKQEYWEEVKERIKNNNASKNLRIYRYDVFKD